MDGISERDVQVTIVRIAIEEILEKTIDPHSHVCTCERICVEITCLCNRERCSRATATMAVAGRDCTMFEITLRIDIRYQ